MHRRCMMKRSLGVLGIVFLATMLFVSVAFAAGGVWTKGVTQVYELPSAELPAYDQNGVPQVLPAMTEVFAMETAGNFMRLDSSVTYTKAVHYKWIAMSDLTSVKPAPVQAKEYEAKLKGLRTGDISVLDLYNYLKGLFAFSQPTFSVPVKPAAMAISSSAGADPGARLCNSDIAQNMKDPIKAPTIVVKPRYGIVASMDPGSVTGNGITLISSEKGILLGFSNDTEETVNLVFTTGWNVPNEQWNVYPCQFAGSSVADQARIKQVEEKKPEYKVVAWSEFKTGKPAVAASAPAVVPVPTKTAPVTAPAASCDSSHEWKGKLAVPAGCILWISSDPEGRGTIDGTSFYFAEGYTAKVTGPATVDLTSPAADNINHWLAPIGVMTADKDGKSVNVKWDSANKKFVER
jgi:hypothetical protein